MKKSCLIVVIAALIISIFPLTEMNVLGANSGKVGDCNWSLNGTELTISGTSNNNW